MKKLKHKKQQPEKTKKWCKEKHKKTDIDNNCKTIKTKTMENTWNGNKS